MARYYLGIDPGQKGGIAIIDKDVNKVHLLEMPLLEDGSVDIVTIGHFASDVLFTKESFCAIEKAQAMPKQGVTSVFNYGRGYGELLAMLKILDTPYEEIRPAIWKKALLLNRDKFQSITLAEKLYPQTAGKFVTKRGRLIDGIAEALLIAHYGKIKND